MGRGKIKPPIETVGQSAFQLFAPTAYEVLFQQPHLWGKRSGNSEPVVIKPAGCRVSAANSGA